ncbi:MAG: hypothetical protein JWN86_2056 [Planctomycetota bacterium]|nr:hypothetical protein [Planctomycetota bacterium]
MTRTLLASMVLAATAFASLADDPARTVAPKGDLAKLQGKWTGKYGKDKEIPVVLEIKDKAGVATLTMDGQDRTFKGEIKLDEEKTPRQWTWTKVKGLDGEDAEDVLSIYKLDGDTLTICTGVSGGDRPSSFEAGTDGTSSLVVLKKVKAEKK